MPVLKPCAHCGSPAESDAYRAFRPIDGTNTQDGIAIYCTGCNCDFMFCRSDLRPMDDEDIMELAVEQWNRRTDAVRDEMLFVLKKANEIIEKHGFAGLDQNPFGIRDLLGSIIHKAGK